MNNYNLLVGTNVVYTSGSRKDYEAEITAIPMNPGHGYTWMPTVSLKFKDERGKFITKERVSPYAEVDTYRPSKSQTWQFENKQQAGLWAIKVLI